MSISGSGYCYPDNSHASFSIAGLTNTPRDEILRMGEHQLVVLEFPCPTHCETSGADTRRLTSTQQLITLQIIIRTHRSSQLISPCAPRMDDLRKVVCRVWIGANVMQSTTGHRNCWDNWITEMVLYVRECLYPLQMSCGCPDGRGILARWRD